MCITGVVSLSRPSPILFNLCPSAPFTLGRKDRGVGKIIGGQRRGGRIPPQPPISYLVTHELFETLMYCVPPKH